MPSRRVPSRLTTSVAATGLATFALLYAPQSVLPDIAAEFRLTPAEASLTVSAATGALALAVIPMAALADRVGRRRVIIWSVLTAAVLGLLLPLAPTYETLLAARALQGIATAGVPATAMAFLAQEANKTQVGAAIGALVAGNSAGGMLGRLITGLTTDGTSWRTALAIAGAFGAACAITAALLLPKGRDTERRPSALKGALTDRVLLCQYAIAVLAVAAFISVFNVIGFRLTTDLGLSTGIAALAYLAYAAGSTSATAGRLADRHGRARVTLAGLAVAAVGAAITLPDNLITIAVGLTLFTGGFFAAHAVASGWVGARAPEHVRGQASGVYLFAFYVGSSTGGTAGSAAYQAHGWTGLVVLITVWLALAAAAVVTAHRVQRSESGQKSSGTSTAAPPVTATVPSCGNVTVPGATENVTDRTSSGTSYTPATGNVSPP
ncbi:YNFM family putative membrane transporter [Saccharothrix ecbatanensis]|uniref:YNFM family putative membrane transporter n=1 Tax=Saccharothrix ecbatanensis TaxID=1105145 RepID=A0A7W9HT19_9PSEU|nr:MFS transporter [Saccharothrix ecbatanensis]MBB5807725.1 YNFM family putative membrane transporter [Saccharothrix ecbatanensis]